MAERDKQEMEAEIMQEGLNLKGSRIICRSGNPLLKYDLGKVRASFQDLECCSLSSSIDNERLVYWKFSRIFVIAFVLAGVLSSRKVNYCPC